MAFKKMEARKYPPRLWGLKGYPSGGKSTFSAQMRGPQLVIDADHRYSEVLHLAGEVYALSDVPEDNVDADRIAARLMENMPNSGIRTIIVDSLTAIIAPLVVQAMVDKDEGRNENLAAAFRTKALAMRQLQDAVTRWGTDALWIYHLQDARDAKGKEVVKATVSAMELVRLTRSMNLQLEIVQAEGRRGVKIVWARRGRSGITLWDESGAWIGMPEKIEAAAYDGLSEAEQDLIEQDPPQVFQTPEVAIDWAFRKHAFRSLEHAKNAYEKLKREKTPKTAKEMRDLWVADIERRLAEKSVGANGSTDQDDTIATQEGLRF